MLKLNESLFEDKEPMDKFYGLVELEFPVEEYQTTKNIERMIKDNISKHTNGNAVKVDFYYDEEAEDIKHLFSDEALTEDWRNGKFTDSDFEDWSSNQYNKIYSITRSARTVARNHPERKRDIVTILEQLISVLSDEKNSIKISNEALKEDYEETSNGAPEAGEDTGVASILNTLIKSEYDAIEEYNSAIATIASRDNDYSEMINVLTDIVGEEQVHVGQLTEVMKLVSPNVEKQEEGKQEAQEQINEPVESEIIEESLNEAKKASDPKKIERAKKACLDALKNGSTQSEEIIQGVKFIYGITREEAEKAFKEAHNIYASKNEDLDSTSTATDIVRELYSEFPKLYFIDERDMKNDKVALFFRFGKGLDLDKLEDYLKERNINYVIKNDKMRIITDEDKINEDFVFYKPNGEHLNFNPLKLGSSLELGDEVYDSKTGHKLRVDSEPVDFRWSRRITFLDLDTNEHRTQDVGINSLWTEVVEGDTAEEISDDDFDIEWHPASDLTEAKRDMPSKEKDLMKYAESQIEDDNDKIWEYLDSRATYVDDVKDIPNKTKDGQSIKYRFSSGKNMNINVYKDPYDQEVYILVDKKNESLTEDKEEKEFKRAKLMSHI